MSAGVDDINSAEASSEINLLTGLRENASVLCDEEEGDEVSGKMSVGLTGAGLTKRVTGVFVAL